MQILFSFDTEDFVDPASNDALKALADIHSEHDVPACFGLVGEKARFLRACGRADVIEAVARHEVAYHSDHHFMLADSSYEPVFTPEYMETHDWHRGVARLVAEEARGVHDVAEITGKRPGTWLRTYGDWAPQYLAAFDRIGIDVFAYGPPCHLEDTRPIWYCNQLVVANPRIMYEQNLHDRSMSAEEKLEAHKKAVRTHLENGCERLGVVTHPTRFVSATWWEEPNWWAGIDTAPARAAWIVPPRFTREQTDEMLWIVDRFVRFIADLPDVTPTTFEAFRTEFVRPQPWLTRQQVHRLAERVDGVLRWNTVDGVVLSPAEIFGVFAFAMANPGCDAIPVRSMFGPTEEPVAAVSARELPRSALANDCRILEHSLQDRACVPQCVRTAVGPVGPGSMLVACAQALAAPGQQTVTMPEDPGLPQPLHHDDYERLASRAPCTYIQKRGRFEFPKTTRLGQLQYWTVKPAAAQSGLQHRQ